MTREELIAYDKWLTRRKWVTGEIISPEKAADLYLAEHSIPPAEGAELDHQHDHLLDHPEGAEEILEKHFHATPYKLNIAQHRLALFAMQEFATLHAQRIAEKMVSERLREELFKFFEYEHAYTQKYLNSGHIINEYLKTREK